MNIGARIGLSSGLTMGLIPPSSLEVPTFQSVGASAVGTSAQAVSPAWPAHQAGDIGLLVLSSMGGNAHTLSVPAGFAEVTNSPQWASGVNANARLHVWWCRATSAAMATPTVADSALDDAKIAVIATFRGCKATGNPWDVTAGDATGVASTSVTIPGATTTGGSRLVVAICAHKIDSAAAQFSAWASADLASFVEIVDVSMLTGAGGGLGLAAGSKVASGAYSAMTATLAAASTQARLSLALSP